MYVYSEHREWIFTDGGQRAFLQVRAHINKLLRASGACLAECVLQARSGDSWETMALLDRMVELEEVRLVQPHDGRFAWQDQIVVKGAKFEEQ